MKHAHFVTICLGVIQCAELVTLQVKMFTSFSEVTTTRITESFKGGIAPKTIFRYMMLQC